MRSFWKSTNFTGDAPVSVRFHQPTGGSAAYKIVYQWLPADDQAYDPTMAVDDNIASFTDPTTGEVQTDTGSGNVYIAWAAGAVAPVLVSADGIPFGSGDFNPNVIEMVTSTDGGQDFNAPVVQDVAEPDLTELSLYGPTTERDAEPAITISQGRLPDESGWQETPGFQAVKSLVGWIDMAANQHQVLMNSVLPGQVYDFDGTTGVISPGTKAGVTITNFPVTVQIPAQSDRAPEYVECECGHLRLERRDVRSEIDCTEWRLDRSLHEPEPGWHDCFGEGHQRRECRGEQWVLSWYDLHRLGGAEHRRHQLDRRPRGRCSVRWRLSRRRRRVCERSRWADFDGIPQQSIGQWRGQRDVGARND